MKRSNIMIILFIWAVCASFASGEQEEKGFSYRGIESVEISAKHLDVEVRRGVGFSVSMDAELPEESFFESRGYRVLHSVDGSRLSVWIERDEGLFSGGRGGKLLFHVPDGTLVRVETVSGTVHVRGLESEILRVRSVSGSIGVKGIRGALDVSSVSGAISIERLQGAIIARTVSGSIDGRGIELTHDAKFASTSGSIDMRLENALEDLSFDLSSVSGSLKVGSIRARRGLRMGEGQIMVRGETISGSQMYR